MRRSREETGPQDLPGDLWHALHASGTIGARSTPGGGRCFHCDGTGRARPLWEPAGSHA
ncbi:hypothetical protein [Streptomyces sp. NBC_00670]|jgi:hypothetical protein|uniref:hypothetical protein n=1 Tax=Streptomyces sp. NBC_00670 TaxID=2975804 RepID=UPI002E35AE45|nr:hypothetical protein [Streptomyces sp. NBC_00670]